MDSAKEKLRSEIRANRSTRQRELHDWSYLLESSELHNARVVASYFSYGNEPSTERLNLDLLKQGKNLLLPRLLPDRNLEWIPWNGDENSLSRPIQSGYREPVGNKFNGTIELFIVPSLAIDRQGHRLGQGGGSYDRALKEQQSWKVALIFDDELLDSDIPVEPHDQSVNAAVTPTRIARFS